MCVCVISLNRTRMNVQKSCVRYKHEGADKKKSIVIGFSFLVRVDIMHVNSKEQYRQARRMSCIGHRF
jgi:hypothetical protein